MPGFLPVRQLVLVDLLSLMVATRPGERAVIAVDGLASSGRARLVAELLALAPHVAGRQVCAVSMSALRGPAQDGSEAGRAGPLDQGSTEQETLRSGLVGPFRAGGPLPRTAVAEAVRGLQPTGECSLDALLIVEGDALRSRERARDWDATCLVMGAAAAAPELRSAAQAEAQRTYQQQARLYQPTWIVDNTDPQRPVLIEPDPEEPQWFEGS